METAGCLSLRVRSAFLTCTTKPIGDTLKGFSNHPQKPSSNFQITWLKSPSSKRSAMRIIPPCFMSCSHAEEILSESGRRRTGSATTVSKASFNRLYFGGGMTGSFELASRSRRRIADTVTIASGNAMRRGSTTRNVSTTSASLLTLHLPWHSCTITITEHL